MKNITIPVLFLFFSIGAFGQPLKVEIENNARFENTNYMINEAGEDFPSIESESNVQVSITYSNYWDKKDNPNGKWRINVHKSDIQWNSNLMLQIKRTGNGYKGENDKKGNIHDGDNYQTVTNTPIYFFQGKDEINYIPLQLKIEGLSVTMGAQDFETKVVLTVYDDW